MIRLQPYLLTMALLPVGILVACEGGPEPAATVDRDTLTRDQRDSIVGESSLPGAGGVQGARRARDRANARTERHDTLDRRED